MPVILAAQEAEIRRIAVQGQLRQTVLKDPISKNSVTKKLEFKVKAPITQKKSEKGGTNVDIPLVTWHHYRLTNVTLGEGAALFLTTACKCAIISI
jgi:hypothetical protein